MKMYKPVEEMSKRERICKELQSFFAHFAQHSSRQAGRASSFSIAVFLVIVWAVCGPLFNFSISWQVTIDTTCSIVTLLMVLLI